MAVPQGQIVFDAHRVVEVSMTVRIGVDLGGTKIEAIALSDDGEEMIRRRIASPRGEYAATIRAIVDLVTGIEAEIGENGSVGVGTPGSASPTTGLLRNANSTWLNGQPFAADLCEALQRPVRCANDANCFAVSEARDGAGAGADTVFGVILGTGVGGGVVVNGRLLGGANGISGEWGHTPMPGVDHATAHKCWCGRRGCIETYLCGPALAREFDEAGTTAAQIAERDDAAAVAHIDLFIERLGRALAGVVNIVDPDVIVLGGGLSNIKRLYRDVPSAMRPHVFSDHVATRIVQNTHGDSSGVRGAAWLWQS